MPLYQGLSDLFPVSLGYRVNSDGKSTKTFSYRAIERRINIIRFSHVDDLGLNPCRVREGLRLLPLGSSDGVTHIEQEPYARNSGNDLFDQF